nr:PREDICTED: zinc finger protein 385B-like isoform X2 [Tribolium castaneum]|eukprot:XP_008194235.1 PREDICTED: zinc finger protein 385B-like isoform X2 [Tribolium castaneum]
MSEFHNSIEEVQLNEKNEENSDKNALSCELCNVKVTSVKILQRHLEGRRHKMKEERQGKTFVCELCDVVANSEIQLNIHLNKQADEKRKLHFGRDRNRWLVDLTLLCRLYFY